MKYSTDEEIIRRKIIQAENESAPNKSAPNKNALLWERMAATMDAKPVKARRTRYYWAAAAAMLLIFAITGMYTMNNHQTKLAETAKKSLPAPTLQIKNLPVHDTIVVPLPIMAQQPTAKPEIAGHVQHSLRSNRHTSVWRRSKIKDCDELRDMEKLAPPGMYATPIYTAVCSSATMTNIM